MKQLTLINVSENSSWEQVPVFPVWQRIFQGCLAEAEEDAKAGETRHAFPADPVFFLLLGERKAGKDALAMAFAFDAQQAGARVLAGSAREIQEELARLDEAGREACVREIAACGRAFLYLKRVDLLSRKRKKLRAFAQFLERLRALPHPPVAAATACDGRMVSEELLDLFQVCPLSAPEPADTAAYLEMRFAGKLLLEEGVSFRELAEETRGASFGELRALTAHVLRFFRSGDFGKDSGKDPRKDSEKHPGESGKNADSLPVLTKELFTGIRQLTCPAAGPGSAASEISGAFPAAQALADAIRLLQSPGAQPGARGGLHGAAAADPSAGADPAGTGTAGTAMEDTKRDGVPEPGASLEKLEASDREMEEAGAMLEGIRDDIGKGAEDYTDEELAEMGYEPEPELPEDEDALGSLDREARDSLFSMLETELF